MKRLAALAVLTLAWSVAAAAPALAAPATGTTALLGDPVAGASVAVDVSVLSATPVVAYDYAIVNACWFTGRAKGPSDSYQRDAIVDWVFSSPPPQGSVPHAIMPVDLTSVPAGSTCSVWLMQNNTQVKGSATRYEVVPA